MDEPNIVECPNCGYEGTAEEFAAEDLGNDKCPMCGFDQPTYEV